MTRSPDSPEPRGDSAPSRYGPVLWALALMGWTVVVVLAPDILSFVVLLLPAAGTYGAISQALRERRLSR